jgi:hypothetical protein
MISSIEKEFLDIQRINQLPDFWLMSWKLYPVGPPITKGKKGKVVPVLN